MCHCVNLAAAHFAQSICNITILQRDIFLQPFCNLFVLHGRRQNIIERENEARFFFSAATFAIAEAILYTSSIWCSEVSFPARFIHCTISVSINLPVVCVLVRDFSGPATFAIIKLQCNHVRRDDKPTFLHLFKALFTVRIEYWSLFWFT